MTPHVSDDGDALEYSTLCDYPLSGLLCLTAGDLIFAAAIKRSLTYVHPTMELRLEWWAVVLVAAIGATLIFISVALLSGSRVAINRAAGVVESRTHWFELVSLKPRLEKLCDIRSVEIRKAARFAGASYALSLRFRDHDAMNIADYRDYAIGRREAECIAAFAELSLMDRAVQ